MKKFICTPFCLVLLNSGAFAANWVQIGKKIYADKDTFEIKDNRNVVFWLKMLNNGDFDEIKNQKIWYILAKQEIDCTNRKIRNLSTHVYGLKEQHIAGDDILSSWEEILPDSRAEFWYDGFCK